MDIEIVIAPTCAELIEHLRTGKGEGFERGIGFKHLPANPPRSRSVTQYGSHHFLAGISAIGSRWRTQAKAGDGRPTIESPGAAGRSSESSVQSIPIAMVVGGDAPEGKAGFWFARPYVSRSVAYYLSAISATCVRRLRTATHLSPGGAIRAVP